MIAPLAATIVERRFPEGDQFLFIRSDGKAIQAEFVDPDSDGREGADAAAALAPGERVPLAAMILGAGGTGAEVQTLEEELAAVLEALGVGGLGEAESPTRGENAKPGFLDQAGAL